MYVWLQGNKFYTTLTDPTSNKYLDQYYDATLTAEFPLTVFAAQLLLHNIT